MTTRLDRCPRCGRPPSERIGRESRQVAFASLGPPRNATPRCKNPFHDLADAGPEMYEALRIVGRALPTKVVNGQHARLVLPSGDVTAIRAALAKAEVSS